MERAHPQIGIDTAYGQCVDDIDINLSVLHDYLTTKGLNTEQINETIIHFSSKQVKRLGRTILGRCYPKINLVELYILDGLKQLHVARSQDSPAQRNAYAQQKTGQILIHELEHRIIHAQPLPNEMQTYNDRVSRLYDEAFTDDEKDAAEKWVYNNSPEEARCNLAETNTPADLITIKLKSA